MRLHHLAVVCHSRGNADRFYEAILGLEKMKSFVLNRELTEQIFDISCECQVIQYGNEYFAVEVFVTDPALGRIAPFVHLCLEVEDREGFVRKCQSAGLPVNRIPKGDSFLTFVRDYDGNLFEIKEKPG